MPYLHNIEFNNSTIENSKIIGAFEMDFLKFKGESRLKDVIIASDMKYIEFEKGVTFENVDFTGTLLKSHSKK